MSKKEMTTEKRLKVRLYLSLLVYTVVGYGLTLILDYIFSKFDNGIFAWLYRRLDLLFILYLMIGFVCIFNYYWKKPWGYLDEVIDASFIFCSLLFCVWQSQLLLLPENIKRAVTASCEPPNTGVNN